jgi:GTPase SAR1 family protein
MKSIKFSDYVQFVKPEYTFIKLTPNNSIRNNNTHKIAKAVASLYKNAVHNIKIEEKKLMKIFKKEFVIGTKYSYTIPCKVSYFIYIEKKKVEFYFIIPKQHLSIIKEKIGDAWKNITINEVEGIPGFSEDATKFQMVYRKEDALSLEVDRRDNDLLKSNLNVVDVLEEGDKVGIFYNFVPISQFSWRSTYENTMKKVKKNTPVDRNKFGISYIALNLISFISKTANEIAEILAGETGKNKDERHIKLFESALERLNGRKQVEESTIKKGNDTILDTQILVLSESKDKLKQINNAKSLSQSFHAVSGDNSLKSKSFNKKFDPLVIRISGCEVNKVGSLESQNFLSIAGRELLEQHNFIEKVETQETQIPEDLQKGYIRLGTSTFRGHKQEAYLSTDKEYKKLTLAVIGPSRAGKSTYIGNLIHDVLNNGECAIVFDFIKNCELSEEVSALFPKDKILNIDCEDPDKLQGLGYNEYGKSDIPFVQYDNAKKQTTQLMALINSINAEDTQLRSKMERYLISAALVVFLSNGSINDVFSVLQNHKKRHEFIKKVPESQANNMEEYIENLYELDDYTEESEKIKSGNSTKTIKTVRLTGTKDHLITGIIDRLTKLKMNTYMEMMLKEGTDDNINLVDEMQKNQLICIKMPESMFTTPEEKDICTTYWMTKIWSALQVRGSIMKEEDFNMVNLVIDELYQVNNTEKFLKGKLSQIAKFGMKPIISCHYIEQLKHIRSELRSANVSYMLISGCDKDNFKEFKDELAPFVLEDLLRLKKHHSMNLIKCNDGYGRFITHLPKPVGEGEKDAVKPK